MEWKVRKSRLFLKLDMKIKILLLSNLSLDQKNILYILTVKWFLMLQKRKLVMEQVLSSGNKQVNKISYGIYAIQKMLLLHLQKFNDDLCIRGS